nr:glycosyltransferase family 2 protein [Priestia aryabhattai]MDH3131832.1 glycosyltransferase family 2 protein [Priestia aryabhattai]
MRTLSVVLPVYNEEETLKNVLKQIKKVNVLEIIVVANGCTDASVKIAKEEGCTVKVMGKRLSPHEARMEGAKAAKGDAVLFVDGDIILSASELERFVQPLLFGHSEVVLNKWGKTKMNACNRSELTWSAVLHHAIGKPHHTNAYLKAPYGVLLSVLKNYWELSPLSLFVTFLTQYRVSMSMSIETGGKEAFVRLIARCAAKSEFNPISSFFKHIIRLRQIIKGEWICSHSPFQLLSTAGGNYLLFMEASSCRLLFRSATKNKQSNK